MNNLRTDVVADPNKLQPFTAISAAFLQDATITMLVAAARSIVGDSYSSGTPYAIAGLNYTGTAALPSSVGAGFILFNNEIMQVLGGFGPAATGAAFGLVTSNGFSYNGINADPVEFTDATLNNVHDVRVYQITDALGGLFQLSAVVFIQEKFLLSLATTATLLSSYTGPIKFYKDLQGNVFLNGQASSPGSPTSSTTVFTLPSGYRPTAQKYFPCVFADSLTILSGWVLVLTNGNVQVVFPGTPTGISLFPMDAIRFNINW